MSSFRKISPRIFLFDAGTPVPAMPESGLALPVLRSAAFGDGSHPTTRLCAGAVDFHCRQYAPRSVLDVGTGTGVLARIARARGASRVVGTDIDPAALAAAEANAALDRLPGEMVFTNRSPDSWGPSFDLVIANILEGPLRELAPQLARALTPNGTLFLSGFTRLQISALRVVFEGVGLRFAAESNLEDWALLQFQRV